MKLLTYTVVALLSAMIYTTPLFAHTTESNTLKVYVIAGQSNASALAFVDYQTRQEEKLKLDLNDISNIEDIPYSFWAGANNQCVNTNGQSTRAARSNTQTGGGDDVRCAPGETLRRANPFLSGTAVDGRFIPMEFDPAKKEISRFGIEASMARRLKSKRDSNFAIIKVFQGGTNLNRDWNSQLQGETQYSYDLYSELVREVRDRLSDLSAMNPLKTIELAGLVWVQGETDSRFSEQYMAYETNLLALISNFKAEFINDDLPVYITELSARPHFPGTTVIREAQWALVQKRREYRNGEHDVQLIHTSDLEFDSGQVHYTSPSYVKIGQRIADKIIAVESQQDPLNNGRPELIQYYNPQHTDFRSTRVDAPNANYRYRRHLGRLYTSGNGERYRLVECRRINSNGTRNFLLRIRLSEDTTTRCGHGESFASTPGFIHKNPLVGQRSPLYRCFVPSLKTHIIGTTPRCGIPINKNIEGEGDEGFLLGYIDVESR